MVYGEGGVFVVGGEFLASLDMCGYGMRGRREVVWYFCYLPFIAFVGSGAVVG